MITTLYGLKKEQEIRDELSKKLKEFGGELYQLIHGKNPFSDWEEVSNENESVWFKLHTYGLVDTTFLVPYDYDDNVTAIETFYVIGYGFDCQDIYIIDNERDWHELTDFTIDELLKFLNNLEGNLNILKKRFGK